MRRWKNPVLAVLALTVLTGCGAPAPEGRETPAPAGLYEQASGIAPDAVLLTVAGREVPAWRYLYWLTYHCDYLREAMDAEGLELDWSREREDGRTTAQYVKDQARDTAVLYAVVETFAEEYDCGLIGGDVLEREWQTLCAKYGGEDRCLGELAWMGLTRAEADAFTADYCRYGRLQDLARTPESALAPRSAELTAFGKEHGYITAEILTISTQNTDEAALAERRERIGQVRKKLSESADPAGSLPGLAETFGGTAETVTFIPGDGRADEAAERAAQSLAEGTWSEAVEVPGGLSVVLRRPLDTAALSADWLDACLQEAAAGAEITAGRDYDAIDPAEFYEKLTAARGSLDRSGGSSTVP